MVPLLRDGRARVAVAVDDADTSSGVIVSGWRSDRAG